MFLHHLALANDSIRLKIQLKSQKTFFDILMTLLKEVSEEKTRKNQQKCTKQQRFVSIIVIKRSHLLNTYNKILKSSVCFDK